MESGKRAGLCCLMLLLAMVTAPVHAAAMHTRRAVAETSPAGDMNMVKICHSSTPCGWAVYIPFTRRVDYFMKNTCDCPKGKDCMRTDDDLSVSAYVYRCRNPPLANDERESLS
ncbi:uncharacterized protein [Anabrus simplex]|uniref:uncharacterized protein n=1 Tax=Anabrus simplex TaxID=316456 RepID=UPI0035A2DEFE